MAFPTTGPNPTHPALSKEAYIEKLEEEKVEHLKLLREASQEIKELRGEISRLVPRAEAYDAIEKILALFPDVRRGGMGEDLAWKIDRLMAKYEVPL